MIGVTAAEFFDLGEDVVVLGKSISVGKKKSYSLDFSGIMAASLFIFY
jgi:hypothetical protein